MDVRFLDNGCRVSGQWMSGLLTVDVRSLDNVRHVS